MQNESKDYYTVLGVSRFASQQEIKQAYKQLALIHHPDRNHDNSEGSLERFREICWAYEVLSDSEKRKNYDVYGLVQTYSNGSPNFNLQTAQNLFKKYFNDTNMNHHYENESTESSNDTMKDEKFKSHSFSTKYENSDFYGNSYDPLTHLSEVGGEGIFKSVTTSTRTLNGETTTIKRTIIKKKNGSKDITEETTDQYGISNRMYSLGAGEGYNNKPVQDR